MALRRASTLRRLRLLARHDWGARASANDEPLRYVVIPRGTDPRGRGAILRWMPSLDLDRHRKIVVLTGAGISVASGLRPYRGPGGLWEASDFARMSHASILAEDPAAALAFFSELRRVVVEARPNAAHLALAAAEARLPVGATLTILTQNVDGLHEAAGSRDVVALHGRIRRTRCLDDRHPSFDDDAPLDLSRRCASCGGMLRPDVVLFGEALSVDAEVAAKRALRDCDLFLAVGTSGTVSPASNFVRWANYEGARTVYVNVEPMSPPNPAFDEVWLGPAEELLPEVLDGGRR